MNPANLDQIPHDQRWDHLKPIIIDNFLGRNSSNTALTLPKLAEFMKTYHGFHAQIPHYRYRLKGWGISKRTVTEEKVAIATALGKRNRPGASSSDVTILQGGLEKQVDKKQLKRFFNDRIRNLHVEPLTPGLFSRWNLPYAALIGLPENRPGPSSQSTQTPPYLNIESPKATSPGRGLTTTSPTVQLAQKWSLQNRSNLLLQDRREELLACLSSEDQQVLSTWLHDYYMHSFMTAKFWGKGPQQWTAGLVSRITLPQMHWGSPAMLNIEASTGSSPSQRPPDSVQPPTQFCKWVIHHDSGRLHYEPIDSPPCETQEPFEEQDQSTWTSWPTADSNERSLQSAMQESFTHNRFSAIPQEELPISMDLIKDVISKSPEDISLDSWAFSIRAGNLDFLHTKNTKRPPKNIGSIYPYHLAAYYLDGGHTCCNILDTLRFFLGRDLPIALNIIDVRGHTVMDNLLIKILSSHTSLKPSDVSPSFTGANRFEGEEKSICGRWDADSPAIRQLFKAGYARIPTDWKHGFCHSAVQAVCHSMIAIYGPTSRPEINFPSGLFGRRCTNCGLELKLGPLHALVVVAFYLGERGMKDETLFGAIACLVTLLVLGADGSQVADVSGSLVFDIPSNDDKCIHQPVNAAELAHQVPHTIIDQWQASSQLGWRCFCLILHRAANEFSKKPFHVSSETSVDNFDEDISEGTASFTVSNESETSSITSEEVNDDIDQLKNGCSHSDEHYYSNLPVAQPDLGLLWSTIQTELLTHRRVSSMDQHVSNRFQMLALERWLLKKTETFETQLLQDGMMRRNSPCGWFHDNADHSILWTPEATDVSTHYFMNLDVWSRTSFVGPLGW